MSDRTTAVTGWTTASVDGAWYGRRPIRTPWLSERDVLADVLAAHAGERSPSDTVAVSEKVAVLLAGLAVPVETVTVGWEARLLARLVRPRPGSRGLSVPEKMQYVLDRTGRTRTYAAALAALCTRPFGVRGYFYRVAGSLARDLDGGRPPYEHLLFPPLPVAEAAALCAELETRLGAGVAIVDLNDFGGTIRATSPRSLPPATLLKVLSDNPLGQRSAGTPFALVRPLPRDAAHA
ncbi:hypothetical protein [Streptomyces sp. SBT349]|uniref:hypothetical protein n=1 Tax=Streptomyces sp. SBT349 TaxID=1580539 RepID=UPI000AF20F32|nr:hypothetical protein [Streptomyces sp. SBT349]